MRRPVAGRNEFTEHPFSTNGPPPKRYTTGIKTYKLTLRQNADPVRQTRTVPEQHAVVILHIVSETTCTSSPSANDGITL